MLILGLYVLLLLLVMEFFLRDMEQRKRMQTLLGLQPQSLLDKWVVKLGAKPSIDRWLARMSMGFSFMPYQRQGVRKNQVVVLILSLFALLVIFFFLLIYSQVNWKKALISMLLAGASGFVGLSVMCQQGRQRLAAKLPQIYRLLSSFYLVHGDMNQSLKRLIPELPKNIQPLFSTILSASLLNDLAERKERFLYLMHAVNLEYFTLLVYIIDQAGEKGGKKAIEAQFVSLTRECLLDLEQRRQIKGVSRGYQGLFVLLVGLFFMAPWFNRSLTLDGQQSFYASPQHHWFVAFFVLLLIISFGLLHHLERGQ